MFWCRHTEGPCGEIAEEPLPSLGKMVGNIWGAITGEWADASRPSCAYAMTGIVVLVIAILVISHSGAT